MDIDMKWWPCTSWIKNQVMHNLYFIWSHMYRINILYNILMHKYIEKAWKRCNIFIILVILWVGEYIFDSMHVCIHLNKCAWMIFLLILGEFCLEGKIRSQLFVTITHCFLGHWTGVWSVLSLVKSHFSGHLLHWDYLGKQSLCTFAYSHFIPAESYSRAVWTLHYVLSSSGLWLSHLCST